MSHPEDDSINLITYAIDEPGRATEVRRYLDLQVLNSIRCCWPPERIQIRTNLDYRCVDYPVRIFHVNAPCKTTFAKWIGLRDALMGGAQKIWSHDHDGWQLNPFPMTPVERIRMFQWSSDGTSPLLCSASFFITAAALPFVLALIEFEQRQSRDQSEQRILDEYVLARFLAANLNLSGFVATDLPITYCYNHYGDAHRPGLAELQLDYLHHKLPIVLRDVPWNLPDGFKQLLEAQGQAG